MVLLMVLLSGWPQGHGRAGWESGRRSELSSTCSCTSRCTCAVCELRLRTGNCATFANGKNCATFTKKTSTQISRESVTVYSTAGGFTDYSCELYATTTAAPRGRDSRLWTHVWTESLKCTVPALSCYNYCAWRGPSTVLPSGVRCGQNVRADILETGVHAALVITA